MSSVGSSYAVRKNKKFISLTTSSLWTSAELYGALTASGYSATPTRLGQLSIASATIASTDLLGSTVTFATDADITNLFSVATVGLTAKGTALTQYETLTSLGRKLRMGTVAFPDLLTFTQVKRTDRGPTTTNGDAGISTSPTDDSAFAVYWVLTDSTAALGPSGSALNGIAKAKVGVLGA